ncbi:MAG: hypothetical protein ABH816_00055 [Candidatus Levyibacteriota bacterium]
MSRHKTRQQKIIANLRRELHLKNQLETSSQGTSQEFKKKDEIKSSREFTYAAVSQTAINSHSYVYLKGDLLKTTILTSSIVVLELLIFILTKAR